MAKSKDDILEQYLKGKSDISKHYQESERPNIPQRIDDVVLSLAKFSVAANESKQSNTSFFQTWQIPLSVAAVFVISVSLVITLYDEYGQGYLKSPSPQTINTNLDASTSILEDDTVEAEVEVEVEVETRAVESDKIPKTELSTFSSESNGLEKSDSTLLLKESKLESYSPKEKTMLKQQALPNKSTNQRQRIQENIINESRLKKTPMDLQERVVNDNSDITTFELADSLNTDTLNEEKIKVLSTEIEQLKRTKDVLTEEQKTLQQDLESNSSRQSELQQKLLGASDLESVGAQSSPELTRINELWNQGNKIEAQALLTDYLKNKNTTLQQLKAYLPDGLIKAISKENFE